MPRRRPSSRPPAKGRSPRRSDPPSLAQSQLERLQKVLAAAGVGSRRECELYITDGRVEVDGQIVTELGTRVDPGSQHIRVDGQQLNVARRVYYALNKPVGVVCTHRDPEGRTRVIDLFGGDERLITVGRLDRSSEGLLLVTNDGDFANRLAHPRYGVLKVYRVRVAGVPSREALDQLRRGIYLSEGVVRVEGIRVVKTYKQSADLEIVLAEGLNREIRRMLARIDHKVMSLKRIAIGPIRLGELPTGAYRKLTSDELERVSEYALKKQKAEAREAVKEKEQDSKSSGTKPTVGQRSAAPLEPTAASHSAASSPRDKRSTAERSHSTRGNKRRDSEAPAQRPGAAAESSPGEGIVAGKTHRTAKKIKPETSDDNAWSPADAAGGEESDGGIMPGGGKGFALSDAAHDRDSVDEENIAQDLTESDADQANSRAADGTLVRGSQFHQPSWKTPSERLPFALNDEDDEEEDDEDASEDEPSWNQSPSGKPNKLGDSSKSSKPTRARPTRPPAGGRSARPAKSAGQGGGERPAFPPRAGRPARGKRSGTGLPERPGRGKSSDRPARFGDTGRVPKASKGARGGFTGTVSDGAYDAGDFIDLSDEGTGSSGLPTQGRQPAGGRKRPARGAPPRSGPPVAGKPAGRGGTKLGNRTFGKAGAKSATRPGSRPGRPPFLPTLEEESGFPPPTGKAKRVRPKKPFPAVQSESTPASGSAKSQGRVLGGDMQLEQPPMKKKKTGKPGARQGSTRSGQARPSSFGFDTASQDAAGPGVGARVGRAKTGRTGGGSASPGRRPAKKMGRAAMRKKRR
jgi:23S rRNA pseudouridine2605 synthase